MWTSTFIQPLSSVIQCYFTSTETIRIIRDGEPRAFISTFKELLGSVILCWVYVHRNNKESRTSTSTFTQLLISVPSSVALRPQTLYTDY